MGFLENIIWLNVHKTNNDPKVIGGYFLESVKYNGGCPCIVRGDLGTENGHVRLFQQFLRRNATDGLVGSSQSNQRIESWWRFLIKEFTGFWIDLFTNMQAEGEYTGDYLEGLDKTTETWNTHLIRPSRNDIVPSGRPNIMFYIPELMASQDKLCLVNQEVCICCGEAESRSAIPM